MSFSQWEINKSNSSSIVHVDVFDPHTGTGSLTMRRDGNGPEAMTAHPSDVGGLNHGLLHGRLRTIIRANGSFGIGTAQTSWAGIHCMQSIDNITASGDCYALMWIFQDKNATLNDLRIYKMGASINTLSGATLLGTDATFSKVMDDVWTMELEWDATSGTQVDLTGRTGTATDFSDLADAITVTDSSLPFTSTVGEGVFHRHQSSGVFRSFTFESTTLYKVL